MHRYQLFSEWRERILIGEDFARALCREKTLRTPARYKDRRRVSDGETMEIAKVHGCAMPDGVTRGKTHILRATVEFTDGRIREIDAQDLGPILK